MTGVELFVKTLQLWGVEFIATLCGHGLNPLDEACHKTGLRLVDVRNEQAAGYMADAYGRFTGQVGVCASSSGVAHVNALTGVTNAFFDGAPMMLITGCGPTGTIGMGHFQDLDHKALADPVCKFTAIIDRPEHIPRLLHEAFTVALNGRPGPVQLTFPQDVQLASVDPELIPRIVEQPIRLASSGQEDLVRMAAQMLDFAQRPILIAGNGIHYARGAEALIQLASNQAIPILTPIWDRGSVPYPVKEFLGVVGAASGGPDLLSKADLILMVGADCDYRVGYLQPPAISADAQAIRIDTDPTHRGPGAHVSIQGDPRLVLEQLANYCARQDHPPHNEWLQEAIHLGRTHRESRLQARIQAPDRLHALDIIAAIKTVLTDDTIIIMDGGNIGQWCHQALCDRYPGHWLTCGASGVVGYGLPAAMTARLLYPDRPIILISGDGSLTFTIAEFETAARQQLGFAVVLADDEAWGITLTGHMAAYGQGITSELGPIRFDQVAQGFGAEGIRIHQAEEIEPALRDALKRNKPTLIHIPVVRSSPTDVDVA